jgi:hypothetical protein
MVYSMKLNMIFIKSAIKDNAIMDIYALENDSKLDIPSLISLCKKEKISTCGLTI